MFKVYRDFIGKRRNQQPINLILRQSHGQNAVLEGVAGNASLNLDDGIHPNRMGVEHIVKSILPSVRSFLEKAMP